MKKRLKLNNKSKDIKTWSNYFGIMRKRTCALFITFLLPFLWAEKNAFCAESPEIIGKFGNWAVATFKENEGKVCYMSLTSTPFQPQKREKTKRGKIVLMITQRPADNSLDVVSYSAGTKFKPASEAIVSIGNRSFYLFTEGDTAWARDSAMDRALAEAIRNGQELMLKGTTSQGGIIEDKLNISGSFQAYMAMNKACGLPVPEKPKAKQKAGEKSRKAKQQKEESQKKIPSKTTVKGKK